MGALESKVYEFGGFRLDGRNQSLTRADSGTLIPLTPKAAELLLFLVKCAGTTVSKEQILDEVWARAIVEESNLSQTIYVLRKLLGDDSKVPRFILTAPNRGYQFIAPVIEINYADKIYENGHHRIERRGTANAGAYDSYVRGRFFWNKRTGDSLKESVEHFEEAIRQDPNFAHAYTGLADSYRLLSEYYAAALPDESFPIARATANKTIEIDSQLAEAHTTLAYAQAFYDWDWSGAETSFKHALRLNPNNATAHQWYGDYLGVVGRFEESLEHILRAIEIDPASPTIATGLAAFYYTGRQADRLIDQGRKIIDLNPDFAYGYFYLGFGYEFSEMNAEAVEAFAKAAVLFGEPQDCADELRQAYQKKGMTGLWHKRLEQFDVRPHLKHYPPYLKSLVPIRLGDKETALTWLNQAYAGRDRGIIYAKYEPLLEPLRSDVRFQDLLNRMGL